MNAKEARDIVLPNENSGTGSFFRPHFPFYYEAKGYLAALEGEEFQAKEKAFEELKVKAYAMTQVIFGRDREIADLRLTVEAAHSAIRISRDKLDEERARSKELAEALEKIEELSKVFGGCGREELARKALSAYHKGKGKE